MQSSMTISRNSPWSYPLPPPIPANIYNLIKYGDSCAPPLSIALLQHQKFCASSQLRNTCNLSSSFNWLRGHHGWGNFFIKLAHGEDVVTCSPCKHLNLFGIFAFQIEIQTFPIRFPLEIWPPSNYLVARVTQ